MRIAVDVMGGDHGPEVVVHGIKLALESLPEITSLIAVGDQPQIEAAKAKLACSDPRLTILHATQVLTMEDKPVEGLRRKKDCSMLRAVETVKDGLAGAVISTGNTGGLVAASTIRLRALHGVERGALATVMPSEKGYFVLVDVGANPDCTATNLAQFGVMGALYSSKILGCSRPRVGILSNGTERIKGTSLTRDSLAACEKIFVPELGVPVQFLGYVEGHDLFSDAVDVVVTEGFLGNIVLKTCESLGGAVGRILRSQLTASPIRKLGAWLARDGLRGFKRKMDPEAYGGAPLLGLNGVVIKAHGSARERAIMSAIRVATETLQHQLNQSIVSTIANANALLAGPSK